MIDFEKKYIYGQFSNEIMSMHRVCMTHRLTTSMCIESPYVALKFMQIFLFFFPFSRPK